VAYRGRDHQVLDWKKLKEVCGGLMAEDGSIKSEVLRVKGKGKKKKRRCTCLRRKPVTSN